MAFTAETVDVTDSQIKRIVLATEETAVTHKSAILDLSNANPTNGHKEVRRSTGYIMLTVRLLIVVFFLELPLS